MLRILKKKDHLSKLSVRNKILWILNVKCWSKKCIADNLPNYSNVLRINLFYFYFLISSFEIGVDMLELDCNITKDGQVVVIHDNNLNRLCDVKKLVSDLNYDVTFKN